MQFTEALELLKKGAYVTRKGWEDGYLAFLPNMQFIWKVQLVPNIGAGNWLPMLSDLCADDWMTLDEKANVIAADLAAAQAAAAQPVEAQAA